MEGKLGAIWKCLGEKWIAQVEGGPQLEAERLFLCASRKLRAALRAPLEPVGFPSVSISKENLEQFANFINVYATVV